MHWKKYPNVTNVVTIPMTKHGVNSVEPKYSRKKLHLVYQKYVPIYVEDITIIDFEIELRSSKSSDDSTTSVEFRIDSPPLRFLHTSLAFDCEFGSK